MRIALRRWAPVLGLGLAVALLAGCVRPADPGRAPYDPEPAMHQQAIDALARWDAAVAAYTGPVIIPVGDPYGAPGGLTAAQRRSLSTSGLLVDGPLPGDPAPTATVTWADGTMARLPTLPAIDALADAPRISADSCPDCPNLHVSAAHLDTAAVATTHGPVTMPVWRYSVSGLPGYLTRPAVALPGPSVTPPPWDSTHPPAGLRIDAARGSLTGRSLDVSFVGGPIDGMDACRIDYTAEALESASAVVVIVHEKHHDDRAMCVMMGHPRHATATLAGPLGERAVLEDLEGLPVPTARLP